MLNANMHIIEQLIFNWN